MLGRVRRVARPWRVAILVLVLLVAWGLVLVLPVFDASRDARSSLSSDFRARLATDAPTGGQPYTILLVGTDDSQPGREVGRADSITLLRIHPRGGRVATLSVPRNLAVRVPRGEDQLAHLMQSGGIPQIARVLEAQVGIEVHHVMHVDTEDVARIVDAVGGVEVRNPAAVRSTWREREWSFRRGRIELDGREAMAFARLRSNELDEHESDSTRGVRQQLVVAALAERLTSPSVILRPGVVASVVRSIRTDMDLYQLASAGVALRRAASDDVLVRCRLGGTFRGLRREEGEPTAPDPLAVARPGYQLARPGTQRDPWLLDPSPRNEATVVAFLDAEPTRRIDRSNADYPVGCARAS